MGGTLTMRPVDIRIGASEQRRYVLEIEGFDAARFVEYMELGNFSARGIFDGTVPLVFDEVGNGRVEGGLLVSRHRRQRAYVGETDVRGSRGKWRTWLRGVALARLQAHARGMDGDSDRRDRHPRAVRRSQPGGGRRAQHRHARDRRAADPVDVNIRASLFADGNVARCTIRRRSAIRDRSACSTDRGNVLRSEVENPPPEPARPKT